MCSLAANSMPRAVNRTRLSVKPLSSRLGGGQGGQVLARVAAVEAGIKPPAPQPALLVSPEGIKGVPVAARPAGFAGANTDGDTVQVAFLIAGREVVQVHG